MSSAQSYTNHPTPSIPPPPPGATGVPVELQRLDQWLAYRAVPKPDGKISKLPIDAKTRKAGSSTDRTTWSGYDLAAKRSPLGAGFVLTREDSYFALDLDACVDIESGEVSPWALDVVSRFPTYWETSFSKTGLRGIGRGVIPGDRCRTGKVEIYDSGRYVVMTGSTLPGHDTIRNCQAELTSWYREVFPPEPPRPAAPPASTTIEDQDVIDRLRRQSDGGMAGRLLDGDLCGFTSASEGRFSLASRIYFYTDDVDQIARILRGSDAWSAKDRDRERDRKASHDAQHAANTYSGERYTPNRPPDQPLPMIVPPVAVGATCGEQLKHAQDTIVLLTAQLQDARQTITTREGVIVRERELRIAAEARANRLGFERSQIMQVLRNPDLAAGPKLTHFATILDLGARIANGEVQTPAGFRLPAKRIADNTGQKVAAVRRHWNEAATSKLLTKTNVRETTEREGVDPETGEILTVAGLRDVTHIHVPEDNVTLLITPIASYRKTEPETRGGKREPRCKNHPDAPTITTSVTICSECEVEINRKTTVHQPESSATVFAPDPSVVIKSLNATVFAPDANPASDPAPRRGSASNFEPEPPAETWATYPTERPTNTRGHDRWSA